MTLTEGAPVVMPNSSAPLTLDDSPLPTPPPPRPITQSQPQPALMYSPPMPQPGLAPMPMGLPPPPMSQPGLAPMPPQRPSMQQPNWAPPPGRAATHAKRAGIQPWMLVLGAIIMAALAFLITRALMHR
jgi:hypothetical protein